MMAIAWYYSRWTDKRAPVPMIEEQLFVADGDSFSNGGEKLRLDGIDAPEYSQTCADIAGNKWECGKVAHAALEQILREPGLACIAGVRDRYARSIATCSNSRLSDIGAAQVANGMAVSDDFYGMRSYGDEEDAARAGKRGVWVGEFMPPSEWRAAHPTLRTKTVPAE